MRSIPSSVLQGKIPRLAPDVAPCPRCGTPSPRNEVRTLHRHAASLAGPTDVCLEVGCYICPRCPTGSCWFRLEPPGFADRSEYTDSTREIVTSLVTKYKLPFGAAAALGRDLFHLVDLVDTTVMRWFRNDGNAVDGLGHLERCAAGFSGEMAIDEVYDGNIYVVRVTDPLNCLEIASWLGEGSPTEADIRRYLVELRDHGFRPQLIVTDGSSLYPGVLAEVFPDAVHQRCTFHFMKGVNDILSKAFWEAYRTMPQPKKRKRGRPKKLGRPRKDRLKRENLEAVRACRWLFLKRDGMDDKGRPRMSDDERRILAKGLALCPLLRDLRRLIEAIHLLIGSSTTSHALSEQRRQAVLSDPGFQALSGAAPVLRQLADSDLFERLTRYLDFENADSTSNHAERENREFRKRQGAHYRLRTKTSMCAFLDLVRVRRPAPEKPRRLVRREAPGVDSTGKEVLAA
jgi:hypothetical protein